jgi:hypothetical protein
MIKSLRDLTLTLARAKLYYNGTVLRVILIYYCSNEAMAVY